MVNKDLVPIVAFFGAISVAVCSYAQLVSTDTERSQGEETTPIKVTARLDRNVITIGDKIRYELTVEAPSGVEYSFPKFGENLGVFAIKDFGHTPERRRRDGTVEASQWHILDTYLTGIYEIPPVAVRYKLAGQDEERAAYVPQLAVLVESLLEKEGERADIRDIKEPVELPSDRAKVYLAAGLAVAAFGVILSVIFVLRRRRRRLEVKSVEMPWETALRELGALTLPDLLIEGSVELFYVTVSGIVRHYLERRFGLRAPEMTTEELLEFMSRDGTLPPQHRQLVKEFLAHCDLVKFARYGPSGEEVDRAYGAAVRLVKETIPQETEEQPSSGK